MQPALIVHGGAGAIAPERLPLAEEGCRAAAAAGFAVLRAGGTALAAVIAATIALEDNPLYNAGTGAVLNIDGIAELDAGLMDGANLEVGAVLGLHRIKNPILLARAVLQSREVLLAGDGAERFARSQGLEFVDPAYFVEANRLRRMEVVGGGDGLVIQSTLDNPHEKHGTVGAVAVDRDGHFAAAASTGGYAGKPVGRVGDTPIAGAGFYAEDGAGAAACTGQGEYFIRMLIAQRVSAMMGQGVIAHTAAEQTIALVGDRLGGAGGLIVIDALGQVGWARNTPAMPYAYCRGDNIEPVSGS